MIGKPFLTHCHHQMSPHPDSLILLYCSSRCKIYESIIKFPVNCNLSSIYKMKRSMVIVCVCVFARRCCRCLCLGDCGGVWRGGVDKERESETAPLLLMILHGNSPSAKWLIRQSTSNAFPSIYASTRDTKRPSGLRCCWWLVDRLFDINSSRYWHRLMWI